MMRLARKQGLSKSDAQDWTYAELDRLYPPLEKGTMPPDGGEPDKGTISPGGQIQGLGDIPASWPVLPDNAGGQNRKVRGSNFDPPAAGKR